MDYMKHIEKPGGNHMGIDEAIRLRSRAYEKENVFIGVTSNSAYSEEKFNRQRVILDETDAALERAEIGGDMSAARAVASLIFSILCALVLIVIGTSFMAGW